MVCLFRFLDAGSDVIETATYQASLPGFKKHLGLDEKEAVDLIKCGVFYAQEVRDRFLGWKCKVALLVSALIVYQ